LDLSFTIRSFICISKTDKVKQIVLCWYDGYYREIYSLRFSKLIIVINFRNERKQNLTVAFDQQWIWSSQVQPAKKLLFSWQRAHI